MDLRELYQEIILDHYRKPRNFAAMEAPDCRARGHNPLCGDKVEVYLRVEDGVVRDVSFQGNGCAISTASASMMTEAVKGKPVAEVEALFRAFQRMVTGTDGEEAKPEGLDSLEALTGVREIPIRVKCATLAWHTLHAALERTTETTTE